MSDIPVYIVDDDESVRDSLAFMLESYDFTVSTFVDGKAFIDQAKLAEPGCVILDSRMPNLRGQQVHTFLNEQQSPLAVIFLTGHGDVPMAVDALKLGAIDFFQKPVDGEKLAQAITKACMHSVQKAQQVEVLAAYQALTEREKAILKLIVKGLRNQQIADQLCIAVRTVEVHRSRLMKKFKAKTVADLVMQYSEVKSVIE